jgi:hypothetical protein
MTHSRVTPQGQAMGKSAARLAERGRAMLVDMGLESVRAPRLRAEMCKTCACQPGSVPNGCVQTQLDFLKAVAEGVPFLCHSPKDGRMCVGWVQARVALVANPLPPQILAVLAKHEFSPPDDDSEVAE